MTRLNDWARANWVSLVGLVVGLMGIAFGLYTWLDSQPVRLPMFVIDPTRTVIVEQNRVSGTPIRVLRSDGTEVSQDLTSVRLMFWNAGREPIRDNDVLETILITLDDSTARILDHRLVGRSRAVTQFDVALVPERPRTLRLSFRILERDDGGTLQVIYEGSPHATFSIQGTIVGATVALTTESSNRFWRAMLWAAFLILAMSGYFVPAARQILRRLRGPRRTVAETTMDQMKLVVVVLVFVALSGWALYRQIEVATSSAAAAVTSMVPERVFSGPTK